MNPRLGNGNMNIAIKTQGQNNREDSIPGSNLALDTKNYNLVTVTTEGQTLKVYVNGVLKGALDHTHNLEELFKGNGSDILGYIAKSNWNDPYCDATVTDFKIYRH